jgi:diguanylate cyclase (GGDEF)-like protein
MSLAVETHLAVRILVVDDDPDFLDIVELLGKQLIIDIVRANSSAEALEKASKTSLNGAILDVQLAGEDISFELASALRKLPGNQCLPLAFISGKAHIYNRVAAADAGASLYLTKPLSLDALNSAVQYLLSLSSDNRYRILFVDDDQEMSDIVAATLEKHDIYVRTLNEPIRILDALHEVRPDLLLLDLLMPGLNGFDVCKMIRTSARWQDIPIIVMTAHTTMDVRVSSFNVGADDYIAKPFNEEELVSILKSHIRRYRLLKQMTSRHPITGLPLHRTFVDQLQILIALAKRKSFPLTLAVLTPKDFKQIRETFGFRAADDVVALCGQLLAKQCEASDLIGHLSEDKIIAAFPDSTSDEITSLLKTFAGNFAVYDFTSNDGKTFRTELKLSVANYPNDSHRPYKLIKLAEEKL